MEPWFIEGVTSPALPPTALPAARRAGVVADAAAAAAERAAARVAEVAWRPKVRIALLAAACFAALC